MAECQVGDGARPREHADPEAAAAREARERAVGHCHRVRLLLADAAAHLVREALHLPLLMPVRGGEPCAGKREGRGGAGKATETAAGVDRVRPTWAARAGNGAGNGFLLGYH